MYRDVGVEIAEAVASEQEVDPMELRPLAEVIDTDALETLFTEDGTVGFVEFEYQGCTVTYRSDGTIDLVPVTRQ